MDGYSTADLEPLGLLLHTCARDNSLVQSDDSGGKVLFSCNLGMPAPGNYNKYLQSYQELWVLI